MILTCNHSHEITSKNEAQVIFLAAFKQLHVPFWSDDQVNQFRRQSAEELIELKSYDTVYNSTVYLGLIVGWSAGQCKSRWTAIHNMKLIFPTHSMSWRPLESSLCNRLYAVYFINGIATSSHTIMYVQIVFISAGVY